MAEGGGVIKDPETGTLFPLSLTPPGAAAPLRALGCGLRDKRVLLINVRVYALACHVDEEAAKKALADFQGKKKEQLQKIESFFAAIRDGNIDMAFTMCFARDLTTDQFVNGIREGLEPKLKAAKAPAGAVDPLLAALCKHSYTTGSRIFLTLAHPDKLHVAGVKAADVAADLALPADLERDLIESVHLISALKAVYFDKDTPSPSFRHGVAAHAAASMLNG